MLNHATGLVIGETSVVGNNVSILQSVTLGGTGKQEGDRHPKIGNWVLISAGAKILGNITIGDGAKVGAGSVVLKKCTGSYYGWSSCYLRRKTGQSTACRRNGS